jgi:ligand-binding SRPBCC domain-containing protein
MKIHTLESEIWLPQPPDELFKFFGDAGNLEALTPSTLQFEILTPRPIDMRAGTLIDYKLRVHGIPIRWRTEITVWEPPHRFVDTQLRGPYRQWIHEHTFIPERGGTLARDRVQYAAWGGALVHRYLIKPDLDRIFAYRSGVLQKLFLPSQSK